VALSIPLSANRVRRIEQFEAGKNHKEPFSFLIDHWPRLCFQHELEAARNVHESTIYRMVVSGSTATWSVLEHRASSG
jgi:hypothetical protein